MAIPDFQTLMLPLMEFAADNQEHSLSEAIDALALRFRLSDDERAELLPSGRQARFDNRVGWCATYLRKAGLLHSPRRAVFQITERGTELLASKPSVVDLALLARSYPEIAEFRRSRAPGEEDEPPAVFDDASGRWMLRTEVQERIQDTFESLLPDEATRRDVLHLIAAVVENADEERSDGWYLKETPTGLRLMAGRLLACELRRRKLKVSVLGPVTDETYAAIGADPADSDEFKWVPGSVLLEFPADRARVAEPLLIDAVNAFIDAAMLRLKQSVGLEYHAPEAVAYIGGILGRDLPQPAPRRGEDRSEEADRSDADESGASREPRVRGRAPIFEPGQRSIASLISDIERGVIALPDLQRPFVWEDTKVRDLLDSLFLGFPVGTLVLWHPTTDQEARALGAERPRLRATTLVIDGQQRLTSLHAVINNVPVKGKDLVERRITIAFRPRDGRFEVADAAIQNDPEFLPNVAELWKGPRTRSQIRRDILNALRDGGRAIDDAYEDAAERNIERAHAIADYRLPTVDLRKTASAPEGEATDEDVAEIFVRINNQGTRLRQADFVLTLLSVFHPELRDRIEDRAAAMSLGSLVALDTQQLLRAACAVAFGRARMAAVYRSLRGVDPVTGESDPAKRTERLDRLDQAAEECMALTPWRDYLLRVRHAGFASSRLIASTNAIVNAFAFYTRGRQVGVGKVELDELVSRWAFGSLLTARYSGASETVFEEDLKRVEKVDGADGFVRALDAALDGKMTGDYWSHTLVAALETQKARAPAALGFRAAQVVLGARGLFSDQLLHNLLDPPADGSRAASELHHLFPEAWLAQRGIKDRRRVNQVANLADTGWHENTIIGAKGPADYVPRIREKLDLDDHAWGRMCAEHALPPGWESMEYEQFLGERRRRMAEVIRAAYRKLGGESDAPLLEPPWFVGSSEMVWRSIVETERALRALVRDVYAKRFEANAAKKIEDALGPAARDTLARALRSRPAGADPLSIIDYLYLGQLCGLLFHAEVWNDVRARLGGSDAKQKLQSAIDAIAPVRNEIAHVREVDRNRLLRAEVACKDLQGVVSGGVGR